jgi:ubiquitin-conjugating enzyme E2 D/E|uniref:E2 ubiquitin-conjugating enzyme n=1 Tax=viral metagenome TaxID=1070528 RepID=A0A6C0BKY6_9ZZZZ
MAAIRRLQKELEEIQDSSQKDSQNLIFSVSPVQNNLFEWAGYIFGPEGSPYQGGAFPLSIKFPTNYPFKPPEMMFKVPIYHPNISRSGLICLDILKHKWSPALSLSKVMFSLSSLLTDPNPDDPLAGDVAFVYKTNREQFNATARQWTQQYAQ